MNRVCFVRTLITLALLIVAGSAGAAEPPDTAPDKQAVLERVRPLAEQGNANAQYNMGVLYDRGYGVERDYDKARKWYKKAAAQGYAKAAHNLGVMYQQGHGVKVDYKRAAYWFKQAARQGEPAAQNNLAVMYARGRGVEKNMRKAALWAARAAQAGNQSAAANLPLIIKSLPKTSIAGDSVNIRSKPSTSSVVLKQSDAGTEVVLLEQRGDWSQILFPSDYVVGWVANFLLKPSAMAAGGDEPSRGERGAQTAATAIAQVGEPADPPDQTSAQTNAQTSAVNQDGASAEATPASDSPASGEAVRVITGDVVNIRKQPSTQSPVLFQAHQGDRVTILKDGGNGWKYVEFPDGRTGWVAGFLLAGP